MAIPKFLALIAGRMSEVYATVIGGGSNANKIVSLDDNGLLDPSLFPAGVGDDIVTIAASENLSAGSFVNLFVVDDIMYARLADASTSGKQCDGFVLEGVSSGGSAKVFRRGQNTQVTGLTPGAIWLSDSVPGRATSTPPSGSGKIVQLLGHAITATLVDAAIEPPVLLA